MKSQILVKPRLIGICVCRYDSDKGFCVKGVLAIKMGPEMYTMKDFDLIFSYIFY